MHPAVFLSLRHFLMDNTAPCGHPLHIPGAELAAVPEAVLVLNRSGEHIGDRFDSPVRMPRETRYIVILPVVSKIVEQKKRIKIIGFPESESSAELDSGSFDSRVRWVHFTHGS